MFRGNMEPTIAELLGDPIARLILARDGLRVEAVWDCLHDAKRRLGTVPPVKPRVRPRRRVALADRRSAVVSGAVR